MKQQTRCVGACFGVDVGVAHCPARIVSPLAAVLISDASSLSDVLLDRDTPPPRLS